VLGPKSYYADYVDGAYAEFFLSPSLFPAILEVLVVFFELMPCFTY